MPDITTLNYSILWDISGGNPSIVLTNTSTGQVPANLVWWCVITTPSGTVIHQGSVTNPDVSNVAWSTITIGAVAPSSGVWIPDAWPTPFGNPPCGQVEFSGNVPYACTLYVKDSSNTVQQLTKNAVIVRPNGNTQQICGNFGRAYVNIKMDCGNRNSAIQCYDGTNVTYNNIQTPSALTNNWTLTYPQDLNGNQPANRTQSNTPNVNFPATINSKGYVLYFNEAATYDYGNGVTVKVQYKAYSNDGANLGLQFAVACDTNLCQLQCQMDKFYKLSQQSCNTLDDAGIINKMVRMNWLYNEALTGILQPLCGIDVAGCIAEIKRIGKFDDNCDCGCGGTDNFGFSNPTGSGGSTTSGCCPSFVNIIDKNTGIQPTNCANGTYYPVQVYDPTGVTVIGTATDISSLISILNSNAAWQVYGIAFNVGTCFVGWYPATSGITIPVVKIISTGSGGGGVIPPTQVTGLIVMVGTSTPPVLCPNSFYPARVYDKTGTVIIGMAANPIELVNLLNANTAWAAYGIASVIDNCTVKWNLINPANIPPSIPVDLNVTSTGCVSGVQNYNISVVDVCSSPPRVLSAGDFPVSLYVDFGATGSYDFGGTATDYNNMIVLLNAMTTKPSTVTFSADPIGQPGSVRIFNTDCTVFNGQIAMYADMGSTQYVAYGSSHANITGAIPTTGGEFGVSVKGRTVLGRLPGINATNRLWHTVVVQNYMLATEANTGKVYFWDITSPMNPSLAAIIQLTAVVGTCFSGVPHSITVLSYPNSIPSLYGLYFPTDNPGSMSLDAIYVVESVTGCAWKLSLSNKLGGGSGVLAGFQDQSLLGKCPRVVYQKTLYFSQDGDMESYTGTSGVAINDIVTIDTSLTFNAGALDTLTIFTNDTDYVWGASLDTSGNIYFIGNYGSVAAFNIAGASFTRYNYVLALSGSADECFQYRLNSIWFAGNLYVTCQKQAPTLGAQPSQAIYIVTADLAPGMTVHNFDRFPFPGSGIQASNYWCFTPLGNCLGILASEDVVNGGGCLAIFKLDGTVVNTISLAGKDFYNVVTFFVSSYVPNSLI